MTFDLSRNSATSISIEAVNVSHAHRCTSPLSIGRNVDSEQIPALQSALCPELKHSSDRIHAYTLWLTDVLRPLLTLWHESKLFLVRCGYLSIQHSFLHLDADAKCP